MKSRENNEFEDVLVSGSPVIDNFRRAARLLSSLAPDVAEYFAHAAEQLAHGVLPGDALGLTGPAAVRARNALLQQAAALTGEASPWRAAGVLARRLAQLPHRRRPEPIDRLLIAAGRCAPVPQSQRRLWDAVANG